MSIGMDGCWNIGYIDGSTVRSVEMNDHAEFPFTEIIVSGLTVMLEEERGSTTTTTTTAEIQSEVCNDIPKLR
jgi:hypothetical protein